MDIINSLLGIIFGKRDSAELIRETTSITSYYKITKTLDYVALSEFSEPVIRAAIHEVKFHQNEKAVKLLSELLGNYLASIPEDAILIPIPLSKKRQKKRGYNQVQLVVDEALKKSNHCIINDAVFRKINTIPQTSLRKKERLQNLKGAFVLNEKYLTKLKGRPVILIDDVVTTGSTMSAARAELARLQPSSITCLALAH